MVTFMPVVLVLEDTSISSLLEPATVGLEEGRESEIVARVGKLCCGCGGIVGVIGETGLRRGPIEAKEKRKLESRFERRRLDFMMS